MFCVAQNVRELAIYGEGATNLKNVYVVLGQIEVGDYKKQYENVLIVTGAAMKTCPERKKRGNFIS